MAQASVINYKITFWNLQRKVWDEVRKKLVQHTRDFRMETWQMSGNNHLCLDVWLWLQAVKIIREIMHSHAVMWPRRRSLLMEWSFSVLKQIKNYDIWFLLTERKHLLR